eukprot:c6577_g1_i1.p1 GENE.c6577_g1_i1~~c6577_g1_i1.p1  ORF type:complete len:1180 (-),score=285.96 c6577_g1_i1:64-3240(-)
MVDVWVASTELPGRFENQSWPSLQSNIASIIRHETNDIYLVRVVPRAKMATKQTGYAVIVMVLCNEADKRALMQTVHSALHTSTLEGRLQSVSHIQIDSNHASSSSAPKGVDIQSVELLSIGEEGTTTCPGDCNSHGKCVGEVCVCDQDWYGTSCDTQNECLAGCPEPMVCDSTNTKCQCPAGFTGQLCDEKLCPVQDCNKHGSCVKGVCECTDDWGGDACELPNTCEGEPLCSGHGSCQRNMFDSPKLACACDHDYHGLGCEIYKHCPSDCSGHGLCDRGTCVCDQGYESSDCSEQTLCPRNCSFHGECVLGKCYCEKEYTSYDCARRLPSCLNGCSGVGECQDNLCVCPPHYFGADCSIHNPNVTSYCPNNCSRHGRCVQSKCECELGFKGDDCSAVDVACPNRCSGAGACQADGTCLCKAGSAGADCSQVTPIIQEIPCLHNCSGNGVCEFGSCACRKGFKGIDCSRAVLSCTNGCSGVGKCVSGKCECDHGFEGTACESPAMPSYRCPRNCSGNGRCVGQVCACYHGFLGTDCSIEAYCHNNCSGHGLCIDGDCVCKPGYGGSSDSTLTDCSRVVALCPNWCSGRGVCHEDALCRCDLGFTGPDCSRAVVCSLNCSGHGTCSKEGRCVCGLGFTGDACETKLRTCLVECGLHRKCHDGQCVCAEGWTGDDCSVPPPNPLGCPSVSALLECSGHGTCVHGKCLCDAGWYESTCEFACPANCSSTATTTQGVCVNGACVCAEQWSGLDCSTQYIGPHWNHSAFALAPASMVMAPYQILVQEAEAADHKVTPPQSIQPITPTVATNTASVAPVVALQVPIPDTHRQLQADPTDECEGRCGTKGQCVRGHCECNLLLGFGGVNCNERVSLCPSLCSGNGWCDFKSGRCECARGFSGIDCSIGPPLEMVCAQNCSGSGICQDNHCACNRATSGKACNVFCPKGCSGNGVCVHGACLCATHYHGDDCAQYQPPQLSPANRRPARAVQPAPNSLTVGGSDSETDMLEFTAALAQELKAEKGNDANLVNLIEQDEGEGKATNDVDFERLLKDALVADGALKQ